MVSVPNRAALSIWRWLVRLYKAADMQVPERYICLAEKAGFSQHELTQEEIHVLLCGAQEQIDVLKQYSVLRRLWHRYGMLLY